MSEIKKYQKKPVGIEALLLLDAHKMLAELGEELFSDAWSKHVDEIHEFFGDFIAWSSDATGIYIETLEGTMHGGFGDYLIKGVKGEFYPCKPDIFELTYAPVTDAPSTGDQAIALLREAGEQFREYERQHRAKKTPEADLKADVNAGLALRIEGLLAVADDT